MTFRKFTFFFFSCLLLTEACSPKAFGQKGGKNGVEYFNKAQTALRQNNSKDAEENLKKAIASDNTFAPAYGLLNALYVRDGKLDESIALLQSQLSSMPGDNTAYISLIKSHELKGDYKLALETFGKYELEVPKSLRTLKPGSAMRFRILDSLRSHPVSYQIEDLGGGVNSVHDEYFPAFTVDGSKMYFTRKIYLESRNGGFVRASEDLMLSSWNGSSWAGTRGVSELINTNENEGAVSIAPDGSFLVFTGCNRQDGFGGCDLYISFKQDTSWTKPVNMGEPINTRFKETQPSISFDGRSIYFSSDQPGSLGMLDIWVTTRPENGWDFSPPVNLGKNINSTASEQSPFIHPDNQTLYFCSEGKIGFGINDIFYARRQEQSSSLPQWDSARNIGYPINTSADQPGLVVDRIGTYGYFSSVTSPRRDLDIKRFPLPSFAKPKTVTYLKGIVQDEDTKSPLLATVTITDLASGKQVAIYATGNDGAFLLPIQAGQDYAVSSTADDGVYLFYSENLSLKNYTSSAPFEHNILLRKLKVGQKLALRNVFFDTDSDVLKVESKIELNTLVKLLQKQIATRLEVGGHTDNQGSPSYNLELSRKRAQSVVNYLSKEGGIDPKRLQVKGYGSTVPTTSNDTEAGKAANRRTEVTIIP